MICSILRLSIFLPVLGAAEMVAQEFNPWAALANVGAVGAVLIWFMFRAEPRLKAIEKATDRQTRSMILLTINLPSTSKQVRIMGEEILTEITEAHGGDLARNK